MARLAAPGKPAGAVHAAPDTGARVIRRCSGKAGCSCGCAGREIADKLLRRRPSSVPLVRAAGAAGLARGQQVAVEAALRGARRPVAVPLRRELETVTGSDLAHARTIEGPVADAACSAVSAQAFTVGHDVVLGRSPSEEARRATLRHELVHVAQTGPVAPTGALRLGAEDAPAEREAERLSVPRAGRGARVTARDEGAVVRRQPRGRSPQPPQAKGDLLFLSIDPDANTVTFVTSAGSLVYDLTAPTSLPVGGYSFRVKVTGNNVSLMPQTELPGGGTFQYAIRQGQPNPATLMRGKTTVSLVVGSRASERAGTATATPAAGGAGPDTHVSVRRLSGAEFTAMTGLPADAVPEGQITPLDQLVRSRPTSLLTAVGPAGAGAWSATPTPMSLIPRNSTGILWTSGHLSVFSNVEGALTVGGYRGNLLWYSQVPGVGRLFTDQLLTGVPGGWQNDWLFPRLAGGPKDPQTVIYLPTERDAASVFAQQLEGTTFGGDYRYSPPRPGGPDVGRSEAGAFERLYGGPDPVAIRCTNNCITVPVSQVQQAIGSRPQVTAGGEVLDISSGTFQPSGRFDVHEQGRAARMRDFMAHPEGLAPGAGQITYTPGAMRGMGVIRVGGGIALIYGVYRTEEHLRSTWNTPEFRRAVGEEAGGWAGGVLGSALGAAGFAAVACAPAGPVDAVCVVAGFVGGLLYGYIFGTAGAAVGGVIAEHFEQLTQPIFPLSQYSVERAVIEQNRRDVEKFMRDNPGSTPFDWQRLQQAQEDFDTWGLP